MKTVCVQVSIKVDDDADVDLIVDKIEESVEYTFDFEKKDDTPANYGIEAHVMVNSSGVIQIGRERKIQTEKYHDDEVHVNGELAQMAKALLLFPHEYNENSKVHQRQSLFQCPTSWDNAQCLKLINQSYKDRLRIAGALIAAEIDRLVENEKPAY